jgi:hypothetical protein
MTAPIPPNAGPKARFLSKGGWWVIGAVAVSTLAFAYYAAQAVRARASHGVGDGRDPASYGFVLEPCLVPRDLLVASGMPKDGLPALADPATWSVAEATAASSRRTRFLVPHDRVIGVKVEGKARAYPLRILVWHEVANDTLAGVPIAVTYNPLCDSAVVFRRTVGARALTFGVSGLVFDSDLVMYDREARPQRESLWSQLLFKAIAGPAAGSGATLAVLPISVETWADWRRENPDTTVLAPDPRMAARYASDPYTSYFGNDLVRFPVRPLPSPTLYPLKSPVVAIGTPGAWRAFPFSTLTGAVSESPRTSANAPDAALSVRPDVPTVAVDTTRLAPGTGVVYASYFAWYATHHADTTWVEPASAPRSTPRPDVPGSSRTPDGG